MNATQGKMGLGEGWFSIYSMFLCVVKKVLTVGKQQHFQQRDFAEYATRIGDSSFCSSDSFLTSIKSTE